MSNIRILRLTNMNPDVVRLSTDKSSFYYKVPEDLVNMGRCVVEVLSGTVQITYDGVGGGTEPKGVTEGFRIVPANVPTLLIRSNITQEGTDSYTNGSGNILGSCVLTNRYNATVRSTTAAALAQTSPLTFLCPQLPSEVFVEKLYYTQADSAATAHTPALTAANKYDTNVLPMEIVLKLTFIDDL